MHLAELFDADACVDLGCADAGVAEHGLNETDIGAPFQHERRHRVAKQVATADNHRPTTGSYHR